MKKAGIACLLLTAAALAGCTTQLQSVVPSSDGLVPLYEGGKGIPSGYTYQLPDLTYRILVTRMIAKCPKVDAQTFADPDQKVQIDTKAIVTGVLQPGTPVVIDYMKMGSAFKTTNFDSGNHDTGMIKSVNASITDHSDTVITEGAKAVTNVAKLAMTMGNPVTLASGATTAKPRIVCTEDAAAERVLADKAKADLAQRTKDLATAMTALGAASKAADKVRPASPAPAATPAAGTPAPATTPSAAATAAADDLEKKKDAVDAATKALASAQEIYDARLAPLTASQEILYTPRPNEALPTSIILPDDNSQAQLLIQNKLQVAYFDPKTPIQITRLSIGSDLQTSSDPLTFAGTVADLTDNMAVVVAFDIPGGTWPAKTPATACGDRRRGCGILYRTIAHGRLRVCRTATEAKCLTLVDSDKAMLAKDERVVPQAGMLVSLPLVNGAFEDNNLKATFREDGTLANATYTTSKAAAAEGLKVFNGALSTGQEFAEWRRDEPAAAVGRQTTWVNALAARDKAIADREQAARDRAAKLEADRIIADREEKLRAVIGDTEATNAILANTNAHIALLEAEKKIDALRNPPSP